MEGDNPKRRRIAVELIQNGQAEAAAPPTPVYQKIKSGRTLGYPITVTQGGTNNKISQHDAILLNCDENPEEYLAKFAYDDKVKIRWMIAGYSDFVAVQTIQLKQIDAAPPTRKAAANSGLIQESSDGGMITRDAALYRRFLDGVQKDEHDDAPIVNEGADLGGERSDLVFSEAIPQPVTSSMAINTDDISIDDEATRQDKEPLPHPVASDAAIKTEEIDTDDEATHQDKNGPTPQPVMSSMAIKTEDIDTANGLIHECNISKELMKKIAKSCPVIIGTGISGRNRKICHMVVNTAELISDDILEELRKEIERKLKRRGINASTKACNAEWVLAAPNNRGNKGGIKHRDVYYKHSAGYLSVLVFLGDRHSKNLEEFTNVYGKTCLH